MVVYIGRIAVEKNVQALIDAVDERSVVLALGPAGTGKTYLAIAKAVDALDAGRVTRSAPPSNMGPIDFETDVGPLPLKGTCRSRVLLIMASSSPARWLTLPLPAEA